MAICRNRTAAGLMLAIGLAYAGTAAAQTEPAQPAAEPVVVAEEAPQGGSREVAVGAGVGLLLGFMILGLIFASD